ncbi:uncharacterized protein MAM_01302 [Metarhizium album ARSEF 1941]|uniref:Uncharacterized protein n=1 Tax=Metarhizium album (strain ARSEF 1941) TaxID=1081103 RepID=A0A0B2X2L0_METAS|nr:uncharacterized protein MAM_01302 [Metarhizium album ARSEF 1941]KHO00524.1 hypothetical protein MAM_01302 [Metarhizium album ARSEF 1941]
MADHTEHVATVRLGKAIAREILSLDKAIKDGDGNAEAVHKENIAGLYVALKGCNVGHNAPKVKQTLEQVIKLFREPVARDPKAQKKQQSKMIGTLTRMEPFLNAAVGAKVVGGAVLGVGAGACIAALSMFAADHPIPFIGGSVRNLNALDIKSVDGNNTTHLIDTDNDGLLDCQYTTNDQMGWVTEGCHPITPINGVEDVVSDIFHGITAFLSNL